ncbi:hypothetical protein M409DRAFT_27261 [Zasmidium cellare ATCC 36951]|uniref:Uncharacterized protein n=1 Tax=Zasmidium cellare ATCC 36951 TaxID=1080233 RepID=A0A6A6C511_ZASCE|nr:uncharacterized protein M409DRAFT_27261 [Zasmidium cellare ATCC 36951]KAF2162257.1 hypothetical protein M409DRAFT_27261 [Zasmidium cellare ATCC 36951]
MDPGQGSSPGGWPTSWPIPKAAHAQAPKLRHWSPRIQEQFEPLDDKTTKKIAKEVKSAEKGHSPGFAGGIFSSPAKVVTRRRPSIGSMLSLPVFGTKDVKESPGRGTELPEKEKKTFWKRRSARAPLKDVAAFRVEIHAKNSADHKAAEGECKQMVLEAGGEVLDDFLYPGGFMYDMTGAADYNPLDDGDETVDGGHIRVFPCIRYNCPQFNPLGMHPVNVPPLPPVWNPQERPIQSTPTKTRVRFEDDIIEEEMGGDDMVADSVEIKREPSFVSTTKSEYSFEPNDDRPWIGPTDQKNFSRFDVFQPTASASEGDSAWTDTVNSNSVSEFDFFPQNRSASSSVYSRSTGENSLGYYSTEPNGTGEYSNAQFSTGDHSAGEYSTEEDLSASMSAVVFQTAPRSSSLPKFKASTMVDASTQTSPVQIIDVEETPNRAIDVEEIPKPKIDVERTPKPKSDVVEDTPKPKSKGFKKVIQKTKRKAKKAPSVKSEKSAKSAEQHKTYYAMPNFG